LQHGGDLKLVEFRIYNYTAGARLIPVNWCCKKCHNKNSPTFDKEKEVKFEERLKEIKHGQKLEEESSEE